MGPWKCKHIFSPRPLFTSFVSLIFLGFDFVKDWTGTKNGKKNIVGIFVPKENGAIMNGKKSKLQVKPNSVSKVEIYQQPSKIFGKFLIAHLFK